MSRNSGIAMAAGGAAVGAAMGNAIANSVRMRSFRKKMVDELISDFGALIATETVVYWVQNDGSTDFAYREYADKQVQNRIYQDVMACYGEKAADFVDFRIQKSREKRVAFNLSQGLKDFLEAEGIEHNNQINIEDYANRLTSIKPKNPSIRSLLLVLGKQPSFLRSVGIVITLITWLVVLSVIANMGLEVSSLAISFCVATLVVILGGRKLMAAYVSNKINGQFEALNEEYEELEKRFYEDANAIS
ncbi:MAG: hypothetical protein ACPF9E_19375 [Alteromonas oceani]